MQQLLTHDVLKTAACLTGRMRSRNEDVLRLAERLFTNSSSQINAAVVDIVDIVVYNNSKKV